jgi:flagellar biosynthesis protein FlhA
MAITAVNIIGGLYIGLVQHGMNLGEATQIFTTLTIGDGLVSQIPAFLIALSTGFLITRSSSDSNLSGDTMTQLLQSPAALMLSGVLLAGLAFTGLPKLPLLALATGCFLMGSLVQPAAKEPEPLSESADATPQPDGNISRRPEAPAPKADLFGRLHVEPLELSLGLGLLKLTKDSDGQLLKSLTHMRQQIAQELGLIVPSVQIRDDLLLEKHEYRIRLKGVEIARGTAYPDGFLALETPQVSQAIAGIELNTGSRLLRAKWIEEQQAESARAFGYRVVDPSSALMIHFREVVHEHAAELLTRQQVHELLDRLKQKAPRMVEELIPAVLSTVRVHQVLSLLLQERVPIRDLESILQIMGDYGTRISSTVQLAEFVRRGLAGTISEQYRNDDLTLTAIEFEPVVEAELCEQTGWDDEAPVLQLGSDRREALLQELKDCTEQMIADGHPPVLLCDNSLRPALKQFTHRSLPRLAVLARQEISRETQVHNYRHIKGAPRPNVTVAAGASVP